VGDAVTLGVRDTEELWDMLAVTLTLALAVAVVEPLRVTVGVRDPDTDAVPLRDSLEVSEGEDDCEGLSEGSLEGDGVRVMLVEAVREGLRSVPGRSIGTEIHKAQKPGIQVQMAGGGDGGGGAKAYI
jgi:hypothetical protein